MQGRNLTAILIFLLFSSGLFAKEDMFRATSLDGTLWVQTSIEWVMSCRQTYRLAQIQLDRALADKTLTAALEQDGNFSDKPPAIILDVDETVLDNIAFQATLIQEKETYNSALWQEWIQARAAGAVPGALEFITYARSKGVAVFYVTNRSCTSPGECPQETDTLENLKALGFPDVTPESLMLKNEKQEWVSEKGSRRSVVAEKHRILLLCGDDLGDFLSDVKKLPVAQRRSETSRYSDWWGERWIVLPNPIYGSWLQNLKDKDSYLKGFR